MENAHCPNPEPMAFALNILDPHLAISTVSPMRAGKRGLLMCAHRTFEYLLSTRVCPGIMPESRRHRR